MRAILEKTINLAKKYGADECDVILSTGDSLSISSNALKIDKYKISNAQVLGLRVIKNNKIGLSYTESLDEDALEFVAKSAVENSEYSNENMHEKITIKNDKTQTNYQISNEAISLDEQIKMAIALESEVLKVDSRIINVPYNGVSSGTSKNFYLNSLGTYTEESFSNHSIYTSATAKNDKTSTSFNAGMTVKNFSDLNLAQTVQEATSHTLNLLDAQVIETGKYDIIFDIELLQSLLGCFSNYFSGKSAVEKTNPISDKLGEVVASTELSLIDSPQYKDALYPSLFDDEGHPQKELSLIENGILKNLLHNSATASFFGTTSNGHASRGAKSALGVTRSNYVIQSGKHTDAELVSGTYLELKDLMGLHSGANQVSGEFSFAANGYLCKDGERLFAVNGITVAGNFSSLLINIKMIGKTIHANEGRNLFAPLIRFADLSVAGK